MTCGSYHRQSRDLWELASTSHVTAFETLHAIVFELSDAERGLGMMQSGCVVR